MSRTLEAVKAEQSALWPIGWIWPRDEDDSLIAVLREPLARGIAEAEATMEALVAELDPRLATVLLSDFERVLGPDPCGRDISTLPIAERRSIAHMRWTARGGQSRAYYEQLAAARGVKIKIIENELSRVDEMRVDCELIEPPEQFIWTVLVALTNDQLFRTGDSTAGDRLYDITLSDIECDIRRTKPAHTEVVFRYVDEGDL